MSKAKLSTEFDIRLATVCKLMANGIKREDIRIEIPLDTASSGGRADIVILSEKSLACVELKSGKDKYCKIALKQQCEHYEKTFDFVASIVDISHYRVTKEQRDWGILEQDNWPYSIGAAYCHNSKIIGYNERGDVLEHENLLPRIYSYYPSGDTNPQCMARILWASEIKTAFGVKAKSSYLRGIRDDINLKQIRPIVVNALRNRDYNLWEQKFWKCFDESISRNALANQENK
jgi:hypothetical protein